jgi:hypothetical protein
MTAKLGLYVNEMKWMRRTAGYIRLDYEKNVDIMKVMNIPS